MILLKRSLPLLIGLSFLGYVIYQVEPPKSWGEATLSHWVLFYIPLLVFLTSALNLLLKHPVKSLILGLGFTVLIALQGLDSLTIITGPLVLAGVFFILRSLNKTSSLPRNNKHQRLIKLKRQ